eukprot:CAMPEP_0113466944 /NCGR_PEP_ID=MMETSP0014_2-20120614/14549_1 /TAXON_ID=2857 /ORGANISM="Nitzschia sp." /LENGTH=1332 /DNA_ID=CAMNT_0000359215 /DNA_START=71 /DNA_END=4070 /DNA_ORIENTATION=+ /assembly_acc=CAM_ASM_000159
MSFFSGLFLSSTASVTVPSHDDDDRRCEAPGSEKETATEATTPSSSSSFISSYWKSSSSASGSSLSLFSSPKTALAKILSDALSEFFVVDPSQIKSNLLSDTRIVLTNVQIRPQYYQQHFKIGGVVDEIEFSWLWGGNEQTSWIRETMLSIRGVRVKVVRHCSTKISSEIKDQDRLTLLKEEEDVEDSAAVAPVDSPPTSSPSSSSSSYLEKLVRQVVDHLTLKMEDINITVDVPSSTSTLSSSNDATNEHDFETVVDDDVATSLVAHFNSIRLISLGRKQRQRRSEGSSSEVGEEEDDDDDDDEDDEDQNLGGEEDEPEVLSQHLSVHGCSLDIVVTTTRGTVAATRNKTIPLLEPFGYTAHATRRSGRRFQDGIMLGIDVIGDKFRGCSSSSTSTSTSGSGLVWHIGPSQARVLSAFYEQMILPSHDNTQLDVTTATAASPSQTESGHKSTGREAQHDMLDFEDGHPSTESTYVKLPLPSFSIVLHPEEEEQKDQVDTEETTRLDFPSCVFQCRLDGSFCILEGASQISLHPEAEEDCGTLRGQSSYVESDQCAVKIDGIFPVLQISDGANWSLDVMSWKFVVRDVGRTAGPVDSGTNTDAVVRINIQERYVKKILHYLGTTMKAIKPDVLVDVEEAISKELGTMQQQYSTQRLQMSIEGTMSIHIENDKSDFLELGVGPTSVSFQGDGRVQQMRFGRIFLSSSSFNGLALDIPPAILVDTNTVHEINVLRIDGHVQASAPSFETLSSLSSFFDRFSNVKDTSIMEATTSGQSENSQLPFSIAIPSINLSIADPTTSVRFEDISFEGKMLLRVENVLLIETNGMSCSLTGVNAMLDSSTVIVDWIASLNVPGVVTLKNPIQGCRVTFRNERCTICAADIALVSLHDEMGDSSSTSASMEVPFAISLQIDRLTLFPFMSSPYPTTIEGVSMNADPQPIDPLVPNTGSQQQILLVFTSSRLKNEVMELGNSTAKAIVRPDKVDEIYGFQFQTLQASSKAGFSSVDWEMISGQKQRAEKSPSPPIKLPNAFVGAFDLTISYTGAMVGTTTSIHVPQFVGTPSSTYDDVYQHIKRCIIQRAPAFLGNATILGSKVGDMAAYQAGMVAISTGSSLTSKVGGGVGGIVAYDGVCGAISQGKKARGASESERYKFGDITRGVSSSFRGAAQRGGELRRGDSSSYRVGDITTGAAASASQYASSNKSRLGGAAGSTIGMAAGAVLLGPVGLVAGSLVGASAGSGVFGGLQRSLDDETAARSSGQAPTSVNSNVPNQQSQRHAQHGQQNSQQQSQQQRQKNGYRFGNVTRKFISKGKEKRGGSSDSGYRFGDFSRGLFK